MGVPNPDLSRCLFCEACAHACPTRAIRAPGVIDLMECDECGVCAQVCPTTALVMEPYAPVDTDHCYELSIAPWEY